MTRTTIAGGALAVVLVLVAVAGYLAIERGADPTAATPPAAAEEEIHQGCLYGRITTVGGASYEGRLRWGGDEEAFWGHYFNGWKDENPWLAYVSAEKLVERRPLEIFGIEIAQRQRKVDLGRPFMARFGDVARIQARGAADVRVTLKSGTAFDLDRLSAGDFDDGVRVWDDEHGVVDVESRWLRTIELLPAPRPGAGPFPLHGTVRTRQGEFTGALQWNRQDCVGTDELDGQSAGDELSLRFDTIRSIARHSPDSSLVTLADGREIVLSGTREAGDGNRGIYVDDRRYGRVLISWDAFERVDFSAAGSGAAGSGAAGGGPAYGDFPPGRPLTGSVTTRSGRRLEGQLVYDLDESETTETLDAPAEGVDYTIPFGLIARVVPPGPGESAARRATVTLHGGEQLRLEPAGDLGETNAGMLIFAGDGRRPEYVPWTDVEQIDFDRPPAPAPPIDEDR